MAIAAAMPPSAITVCALPSSDLQTTPTRRALRQRFDGRAQARAARADDQNVVLVGLVGCRSQDSQVHESRRGDQPHIEIGQAHRE